MTLTAKRFIVDTHAWIGYLDAESRYRDWIEKNILETPASVLAEVSMVLARRGIPKQIRNQAVQTITRKSIILPLEAKQAETIGDIVLAQKLHYADALVYAFASEEKPVLTGDSHFKGKPLVQFIE